MPDVTAPRDGWDKLAKIGQFIAIVAIPLVLAAYGNMVSQSISSQETSLEYVQLALSILEEEPDLGDGEGEGGNQALREWAVRILEKYSGESLGAAGRTLVSKRLPPLLTTSRAQALQLDVDTRTKEAEQGVVIPVETFEGLDANLKKRIRDGNGVRFPKDRRSLSGGRTLPGPG